MVLSRPNFIANLKNGQVYYYSCNQISSVEPHYFIVVHICDSFVHLVCATTQFASRLRFFELRNIPYACLVNVPPDASNGLRVESWIDCNSSQRYSIGEFADMYVTAKSVFKGLFSDGHLQQIYEGIKSSPLLPQERITLLYKKLE